MTTTDKAAKRQEMLDAATTRLADAVEQITTGEDWKNALRFLSRFHNYSFGNTILIHVQHSLRYEAGTVDTPAPQLVAGFNRWKDNGRMVNKGQKGYVILAPTRGSVRIATLPGGRTVRLAKGEDVPAGATVETRQIVRGFTTTHVWDVAQTSGDPIPMRPLPTLLDGDAPADVFDALAKMVDGHGFTLADAPTAADIGGTNGLTDFAARAVRVRADMSAAQRVKTLIHEVAHMLLHDPKGDTEAWVAGSITHRGRAEVEAESVAFVVLSALGVDSDDYTFPYVAGWASTEDGAEVDVVRATGQRVQQTAAKILDALPMAAGLGGKVPAAPTSSSGAAVVTDAAA